MAVKPTQDEKVKGCQGCFFWRPNSLRLRCAYAGKLEYGRYGDCKKRRKPKW